MGSTLHITEWQGLVYKLEHPSLAAIPLRNDPCMNSNKAPATEVTRGGGCQEIKKQGDVTYGWSLLKQFAYIPNIVNFIFLYNSGVRAGVWDFHNAYAADAIIPFVMGDVVDVAFKC